MQSIVLERCLTDPTLPTGVIEQKGLGLFRIISPGDTETRVPERMRPEYFTLIRKVTGCIEI